MPPRCSTLSQQRIDLAAEKGMEGLVEPTVRRWFPPSFVDANGVGLNRVRAMIRETPFGGFVACTRALQNFDLNPILPGIAQPVLLMVGEADGALPQTMRAIQAQIPDCDLTVIPGAGHLVNIQEPDLVNRALSSFLSKGAA
jgi:pimeloyl-ACP methyl ester carboxylesterase